MAVYFIICQEVCCEDETQIDQSVTYIAKDHNRHKSLHIDITTTARTDNFGEIYFDSVNYC